MKICLATLHANPCFTPLSLLYLKASIVDSLSYPADDVTIVEEARDADPDAFAARILSARPAIVGFSCYVWNVRALMAAARRIKAAAPDTIIVLGGPEVGPIAVDVLRANPAVDVIVSSEGEVPFADLVARWREGRAIDDVPGICRRRGACLRSTRHRRPSQARARGRRRYAAPRRSPPRPRRPRPSATTA